MQMRSWPKKHRRTLKSFCKLKKNQFVLWVCGLWFCGHIINKIKQKNKKETRDIYRNYFITTKHYIYCSFPSEIRISFTNKSSREIFQKFFSIKITDNRDIGSENCVHYLFVVCLFLKLTYIDLWWKFNNLFIPLILSEVLSVFPENCYQQKTVCFNYTFNKKYRISHL